MSYIRAIAALPVVSEGGEGRLAVGQDHRVAPDLDVQGQGGQALRGHCTGGALYWGGWLTPDGQTHKVATLVYAVESRGLTKRSLAVQCSGHLCFSQCLCRHGLVPHFLKTRIIAEQKTYEKLAFWNCSLFH